MRWGANPPAPRPPSAVSNGRPQTSQQPILWAPLSVPKRVPTPPAAVSQALTLVRWEANPAAPRSLADASKRQSEMSKIPVLSTRLSAPKRVPTPPTAVSRAPRRVRWDTSPPAPWPLSAVSNRRPEMSQRPILWAPLSAPKRVPTPPTAVSQAPTLVRWEMNPPAPRPPSLQLGTDSVGCHSSLYCGLSCLGRNLSLQLRRLWAGLSGVWDGKQTRQPQIGDVNSTAQTLTA